MLRLKIMALIFGLSLVAALAVSGVLAEEAVPEACLASAAHIAKAVGGAVAEQAFGVVFLHIPNVEAAHYGCAKGKEGLYLGGRGKRLSTPIAKVLGLAAKAISGRDDKALEQGGAACMKSADFMPIMRRSGKATQRREEMHKKWGGEVFVGGIVFRCSYFNDSSTDPEFFVGLDAANP